MEEPFNPINTYLQGGAIQVRKHHAEATEGLKVKASD
jgi:hypothetical protein